MKSKKIPQSVIKKLNRDLAALMPEFPPEVPLPRGGGTVKIAKKHAPMHSRPDKIKQIATLSKGSELQLLGISDNRVCVLHNDETGWLDRNDVEITPTFFTKADGTGISGWLHEKWEQARQELVKRAVEMRNEYQDNEYISIKGFSIVISAPPALSIDFEFKGQTS